MVAGRCPIPSLPALPEPFAALRDHVLAHAVKRGAFTLKSGAPSSWFLDTKQTACRPEGILLVADAALSVIPRRGDGDRRADDGRRPGRVRRRRRGRHARPALRSFSVRKEAKDHGVTGRLAGALEPGDRVVITEDTVTRGTSLMEAVEVVRAFGAEPVLITVIVDRGDTCAAMAAAAGIPYRPLLTAPTSASRRAPTRVRTPPEYRTRFRRRYSAGVQYSGERTPGLRRPAGSRARLTAAIAASSAGVRTRCSQRDLATPTPCSAEIVPPSPAAAPSTSAVMASASPAARTLTCTLPSARWPNGTSRPPWAAIERRAGDEQLVERGRPARRRRA